MKFKVKRWYLIDDKEIALHSIEGIPVVPSNVPIRELPVIKKQDEVWNRVDIINNIPLAMN